MGSEIRVLLIAPSQRILGGQSVQASRLIAALRKEPSLEIQFQPINPQFPAPIAFLQKVKFVRTILTWATYVTVVACRAWRYDILHVFSAAYTSYMLWTLPAMLIGKLYGKKVIVNYRDGQAEDHLRNWRTAIPTLRLADAIVSPSAFLVDVFAKYDMRITTISNILDTAPFIYRQRERLRPLFLHNRILEPLYNIPCSLRAFQLVQQRYPEATLTVAHDGPSRAELEQLARELKLQNTRFIGRVPHAEIARLYDSADLYFTSPDQDCMPGSVLECFASGLPVVATRTGGIPYIAEDEETALLIAPGDHQGMASAAFRLLEEPALVERLTSNAHASCSRYTEGPVREQWTALYRKLLGRHGSHA